jgi:glycosyltransferase involved in cell wall biosynthesis
MSPNFSPLRLAFLQQSYGRFGGAERLAFTHYVQLKSMNKDVTLFYSGSIPPDWTKRLQNEPVRTIPNGIAKNLLQLGNLRSFLRELRNYDRIIIHHHVEPLLAYFISKLFGKITTWYSGGGLFELSYSTGKDYRSLSSTLPATAREFYGNVLARLMRYNALYNVFKTVIYAYDVSTVKGYDKIVANSDFTAKSLMKSYRLRVKPEVVYPAVDPVLERLASENPQHESDYMLAVGALTPQKNLDTIIHAASGVPSAKLTFVGNGNEGQNLSDLARKLRVPLIIKKSEDVHNLAGDYAACKILLHPAIYEPFGLTPIEAALFSKPSIVTNRGGPCETVVDGETGFVTDPLERKNIRKLMALLLSNDELRMSMGKRARNFVQERFSIERSTKDLLAVIEN